MQEIEDFGDKKVILSEKETEFFRCKNIWELLDMTVLGFFTLIGFAFFYGIFWCICYILNQLLFE